MPVFYHRRPPSSLLFPTVVQVILWGHLWAFCRQDAASGEPGSFRKGLGRKQELMEVQERGT